jgi:hypothetical protein
MTDDGGAGIRHPEMTAILIEVRAGRRLDIALSQ